MHLPLYNAFAGIGVASALLVGERSLIGRREHDFWPQLFLIALAFGAAGAVSFSWLTGVTDSWEHPAYTFLGGVALGLVALTVTAGLAGFNLLAVLDAGCLGTCAGHIFGRLGCLFGGCCYGKSITLDPILKWSFTIPTALIESSVEALILCCLLGKGSTLKRKSGSCAGYWMISYGVARFFLEFARGDFRGKLPFNTAGLSPSQCISLVLFALGVVVVTRGRKEIGERFASGSNTASRLVDEPVDTGCGRILESAAAATPVSVEHPGM